MDAFDVLPAREPADGVIDPERVFGDDGRIARELIDLLVERRGRFAPRSAHPVAMMLDEWIARLEAYAARPFLPMPD